MNDVERKDGIDTSMQSYVGTRFVTTDARQMAYDNYESLVFSQSGLAGLVPGQMLLSAEVPRGFNYTTGVNGLGGTPSPIAMGDMTPLVNRPEFASTFLRNITGMGEV